MGKLFSLSSSASAFASTLSLLILASAMSRVFLARAVFHHLNKFNKDNIKIMSNREVEENPIKLIIEVIVGVAISLITSVLFRITYNYLYAINANAFWYAELGVIIFLNAILGLSEFIVFGVFYALGLIIWGILLNEFGSILTGFIGLIVLFAAYFYKVSQSRAPINADDNLQ